MPAPYKSRRRMRVLSCRARFSQPARIAQLFPALGKSRETNQTDRRHYLNLHQMLSRMIDQGLVNHIPSPFHGEGAYQITPAGRALLASKDEESPSSHTPPASHRPVDSSGVAGAGFKCPRCGLWAGKARLKQELADYGEVRCEGCGHPLARFVRAFDDE